MENKYSFKNLLLITGSFFLLTLVSCKKDKSTSAPVDATPVKLGVYEFSSGIYKQLQMNVSKVGTQTVSYGLVFDTGSGGMVIDAANILPASMITSSGFNFTGDSTVVDGITITNQKSTITYGTANDEDDVYGNLAYASVTIGDSHGSFTVKRLPFFLYYKAVSSSGTTYEAHAFDVLGVSSQYDVTFGNGAYITSPFSYYDPGTGLTKGFKMAALGTTNFSTAGTYVSNVVTLGLTSDDLSTSSGFTMHQLKYYSSAGYYPLISSTVSYNSKTVGISAVFDCGDPAYTYIIDNTSTSSSVLTQLASNTSIALSTNAGFSYNYVTGTTNNLTYIENAKTTGDEISIISISYFLTNQYMIDFTDHKLGLK